jgi:MscS family membrane protein
MAAAAAVTLAKTPPSRTPDLLEHAVDVVLRFFHVRNDGNTPTHYAIALLFIVLAFLLRRVVAGLFFRLLRRLSSLTKTTLDDKLFPALEPPVATLILLLGFFAALKVLKLAPSTDEAIRYSATIAFSLVIFWGLLRALSA